jgi:diaminobutyrate-2-oxoglutarate transaminase
MTNMLTPLADKYYQVEIRGKGMIIGLDVHTGENAKAIVEDCFKSGLLVASCGTGGRVVKLIPPLTIPEDDLKTGLQLLIDSTTKVLEEAA